MHEHTRREFIKTAMALSAGLWALPRCHSNNKDPNGKYGANLPSLGGAPDTAEGHAIAAFVDIVIPGAHRDPAGTPGGLDSNAPALFFDASLPALGVVPLLAALLDDGSREQMAGRSFAELATDQRETVLQTLLAQVDVLALAIELAKLAHYSSATAARALGYPGANRGYVGDADFSFRRAMAREITRDGNLD